jgi:hypothetical protein
MRRASLYSSSSHPRAGTSPPRSDAPPQSAANRQPKAQPAASAPSDGAPAVAVRPGRRARISNFFRRYSAPFSLVLGVLIALGVVYGYGTMQPPPHALTQDDIDAAVMHTVETKTLPSQAARAYEAIRGSVVRVR